jgi:para-aminobenzoate synthetase component 1
MATSHSPCALFRDDPAGRDVLFAEPSEILAPDEPGAFFAALEAAEAAHRAGKWLAGYFSYEAGYLMEPKLRPLLPQGRCVPLICLGVFDSPSEGQADNVFSAPAGTNAFLAEPRATWSYGHYAARFERLHRHLREGDCYQANLAFPVKARWSGDPLSIFNQMTARQPVKYGAFIDLAGPVVLSRSPELFFRIGAGHWIETLPMKGTAPRGKTPEQDRALKRFLQNDPKNQAENRMIVDLLRNDISLISEVGTIDVPELFRVDSYPTVHQMVSRVRARLRPGLTIADIFGALFPCGSVTGAPKIRAMEILHDLEDRPRDVYCGAIGWIAPSGRMRFNVAIRTVTLYQDGDATFNVGGGIVFDSTAEEEYAECLLKGRFATGQPPAAN